MADKATVEKKLTVANVEHKDFDRKDGTKGELWKVTFVGGEFDSTTFSKTAGAALEGRKGKELVLSLKEDKEFRGKMQFTIERAVDPGTGEVVYEPESKGGGRKGGGGYNNRPDWTYMDPQERHEERLSIESQKALEYTTRILEAVIPLDDSIGLEEAVKFVEDTHPRMTTLIRKSVEEKSGSGSRSRGAGGQRSSGSSGGAKSRRTAPSSAGDPPADPSRSEGRPSPEPDSSSTELIEQLVAQLDDMLGSHNKTLLAYKKLHKRVPDPKTWTADELQQVVAANKGAA